MREELKDVIRFWKDKGVKGFRFDVVNLISNPDEKELSMCFSFHHLKADYKDGNKWELMKTDYRKLKELFEVWQTGMERENGWNAVFWCNHDQPRIVSRMGG